MLKIKKYLPYVSMLLLPLFLVVLIEIICRDDWNSTVNWIFSEGDKFLKNYLIIFLLYLFLATAVRRTYVATVLISSLTLILSSISFMKYKTVGVPLIVSDFNIGLGALGVANESNIIFNYGMLIGIVAVVILCVTAYYFPLPKIDIGTRLLCSYTILFLGASIFLGDSFVELEEGNIKTSYDNNGFSLGFMSDSYDYFFSYRDKLIVTDNEYSKETMDKIMKLMKKEFPTPKGHTYERPNIITIMSESFFDVTTLDKLEFSEDPIPNFRKLSKDYTSGNIVTSTFGGGTANVEFEYLTGFTKKFLQKEGAVYQNYIKSETPSIPAYLKDLGYETIALHTYKKDFYDRDKVYPLLGFEQYMGMEDLIEPKYEGPYISDETLTDIIIEEYEKAKDPLYLFAVSMENHQPYTKNKYPEHSIHLINEDISDEQKESVEAYVHGLHNADKALGELIKYFEKVEEPTAIIFFGDHQPSIGEDYGIYSYSGVIDSHLDNRTPEELKSLLTTPFVIWSNYDIEKQEVTDMGSNFLGNYVLNYLNIERPVFYRYLDKIYLDMHYISREDLFIDAEGKTYGIMPEEYDKIEEVFRLLQYDMIMGEKYSKEIYKMVK